MCFEKAVKAKPNARDKGTYLYEDLVMREIKFRLFGKNSKEFLRPENVGLNLKELQNVCDIDLWHVMQYTGLKDRNGVEVYEGDVVKYLTHTAHVFWSPQDFGFVHYNEVIGGYAGLSFFTGYKDFEVIGNIHQHPELLESDK